MIKEEQFAVSGIVKVLKKMIVERDSLDAQSYHTLADSLREYMKTVWFRKRKILDDDETTVYENLVDAIDDEMNKLEKVIDNSLDKDDFRSHHRWLMSYQKLDLEKSDIKNMLIQSKKEKNKIESFNNK